MKPIKELYGHHLAAEFGPLPLKAVRARMIETGWSRTTVNSQVNRLKHIWKWGTSEELIPAATYQALRTVEALSRGRSAAKDNDPVQPVPPEHVDAALLYLPSPVRAMVEFMRYTGCRPGEAARLTRRDLDTTGDVWIYAPLRHKNAWRGKKRVIAIGPKAQSVLRAWLKPSLDEPLFSPRDAKLAQWAASAAKRKTKRYPCERKSKDRDRYLRSLSTTYSIPRIDRALYRACDLAGVPRWSANRLRHLHATEVRRRFGIEAASSALGHDRLETTEIYAEKNLELARRIAVEVG